MIRLLLVIFRLRFSPWFCEPIVAGLTDDGKPYISGMDLIGCAEVVEDYAVAGTCTNNLHGMCESLYRPNLVSVFKARKFCVFEYPLLT